jgi:hypothetical protein
MLGGHLLQQSDETRGRLGGLPVRDDVAHYSKAGTQKGSGYNVSVQPLHRIVGEEQDPTGLMNSGDHLPRAAEQTAADGNIVAVRSAGGKGDADGRGGIGGFGMGHGEIFLLKIYFILYYTTNSSGFQEHLLKKQAET